MTAQSDRRDRRLADAPRQGGARPSWWPSGRWRTRRSSPGASARRRPAGSPTRCAPRASRTSPCSTPRTAPSRCTASCPGPAGAPDGAALRALRRAAAAGRVRLALPAVRADRARRPLVRPGRRGLQGRLHHAPARAARPQGERRRPGHRQGDRGGLGGAGHGRPRAVRRGAPGAAGRRHDRHRRHRQLPGRPADGHRDAARHDACCACSVDTLEGNLHSGPVRRRGPGRAGRADPAARLAARRGRLDDGRRARRATPSGTDCSTRRTSSARTPRSSTGWS